MGGLRLAGLDEVNLTYEHLNEFSLAFAGRSVTGRSSPWSGVSGLLGLSDALRAHHRLPIRYHLSDIRARLAEVMLRPLREAFPFDSAPGYFIFDRGTNFNQEVIDTVKSFGINPKRTSYRSPWQNGVAERWVGNCRRDLLDHVIVLNERHLKRLMSEYVRYYHDDRTHLGLAKGTTKGRELEKNPGVNRRVISRPRLGGLHHRYDLAA
jgi:Integrase core domain